MADSTNASDESTDGHGEHRRGAGEPLVGVGGDDDGRGLVGLVDGDFLGHVVGRATHQTGRAHEDERLAGEVDVLLVLGDVAGDALVAELAELDAHFLGGHRVGAVADDGPVALRAERTDEPPRRWRGGWR